jgi:hypothetical protein
MEHCLNIGLNRPYWCNFIAYFKILNISVLLYVNSFVLKLRANIFTFLAGIGPHLKWKS